MNKLINRKVLISMIFIGLTMMGLFSYRYLLMELYPDAEFPSLNVTISILVVDVHHIKHEHMDWLIV